METPVTEISELQSNSSNVIDHNHDNLVSCLSNHGGIQSKDEFSEEEVRNILEVIAATGKFCNLLQKQRSKSTKCEEENQEFISLKEFEKQLFKTSAFPSFAGTRVNTAEVGATGIPIAVRADSRRYDWDKLKSMLSFHLKQILSEYPEAKMTIDQQTSSLGETYPELVKRLDDALHSFIEGPPFTLQRLSEILLAARSIYSNLSKLSLALEKNLLVTSTLTICADPYPSGMVQILNEREKETEPQLQLHPEQNGVEPMVVDRDEVVMADLKADIENEMMLDMSAFEDLVGRPVDPVPRQTGEL